MLKNLLKAMRPRQWTKNVFLLAALVFDRQLFQLDALVNTIQAFIIFCLLSSSVYLFNDVMDIEADKNHPVKRNRPIASGKLPLGVAIIASAVLFLVSIFWSYFLSTGFLVIAAIYIVLNLIYSKWLKHIPLVDVLVLASFYVLRVAAGVSVIQVERFSPWLYVVTTLFALYIGFGKRRAELMVLVNDNSQSHRKVLSGYSLDFMDQLITVVSSTTIIAYSLYTFSAPNLPANHSMMLTIPFVLYGIFRYLSLMQINKMGGEPEEVLLKDRPLQIDIFLWAISVMVIFYLF